MHPPCAQVTPGVRASDRIRVAPPRADVLAPFIVVCKVDFRGGVLILAYIAEDVLMVLRVSANAVVTRSMAPSAYVPTSSTLAASTHACN